MSVDFLFGLYPFSVLNPGHVARILTVFTLHLVEIMQQQQQQQPTSPVKARLWLLVPAPHSAAAAHSG